ncbi:glycosyltransferase family 2 protein [Cellulomonas sp. URHD0024]|uniref:glycosyltransferase family 2 protein n=1 Tax=Cellulomonas sp. URHD0024 TaxID=1302620 RepID=UPI00041DABBC|nr:glycosyltransferase family 2 protein [Cellulomonas sp. URHD0024]
MGEITSTSATEPGWPSVSVVMPARDEEAHLRHAVERVLADTYDGELEMVVVVGPSRDRTQALAEELAREYPQVRVIKNPSGRTPQAMNLGIAATTHPIVVRVDAHGFLPDGYVARSVELLRETGAANVGGQMVPKGVTPLGRAIARAMSSRLGIGSAPFHVGGEAGPTESVYLGVFRREALEEVGGFDEHFIRAQDWELNYRIRAAGHTVWFSPDLRVIYRPRSRYRALAKQFFGSGRWRREIIAHYPSSVSARYLAPPLAVIAVVLGTTAALVGVAFGLEWLRWAAVFPIGYLLFTVLASIAQIPHLALNALVRFPGVLIVMQMLWGAGFLLGPSRARFTRRRARAEALAQAQRPHAVPDEAAPQQKSPVPTPEARAD